ncbi:MAG: hypothetical protein Kilf2KO_29090 [Rhodospirillales bacterium]
MKVRERDRILVIGGSHTAAVYRGMTYEQKQRVNVVNLRRPDMQRFMEGGAPTPVLAKIYKPPMILSMVGGNVHHAYGLVEHPEPFDFATPEDSSIADPDRKVISYAIMSAMMAESLASHFRMLTGLRELFDCPIIHMLSPPPMYETDHIQQNPGEYAEQMARGVSPASLRMKCYRLQAGLMAEHCESLGIEVVQPPVETLTDKGFLKLVYAGHDSTHANSDYGRLVMDKLMEKVDAFETSLHRSA